MIRIALIEDDTATREAYMKLFRCSSDIVCLAGYGTAEEAERGIPKILPDVVLVDIKLPGRSGIECVAKLKRAYPQLLFVMLTTSDDEDLIFNSLRAGASGYLLKGSTLEELLFAIGQVHRGGSPMSMEIARRVVSHFHKIPDPTNEIERLSAREQEVLALLAKGLPSKKIAEKLFISINTVHGHLRAIYEKLHVQSRAEAILKFLGQ